MPPLFAVSRIMVLISEATAVPHSQWQRARPCQANPRLIQRARLVHHILTRHMSKPNPSWRGCQHQSQQGEYSAYSMYPVRGAIAVSHRRRSGWMILNTLLRTGIPFQVKMWQRHSGKGSVRDLDNWWETLWPRAHRWSLDCSGNSVSAFWQGYDKNRN
jgi:hypothetical protein